MVKKSCAKGANPHRGAKISIIVRTKMAKKCILRFDVSTVICKTRGEKKIVEIVNPACYCQNPKAKKLRKRSKSASWRENPHNSANKNDKKVYPEIEREHCNMQSTSRKKNVENRKPRMLL